MNFRKNLAFLVLLLGIIAFIFPSSVRAEAEFDFGLPLFGKDEIRFEKAQEPDFNLQLLKKYMTEHEKSSISQLHGIYRWLTLYKLSDEPRQKILYTAGLKFFSKKPDSKDYPSLNEIFYRGLFLSIDKDDDPKNTADQKFEEMLLAAEDKFEKVAEYSLAKGILFHLLRNRPNGYFSQMKPEEDLKTALSLIPQEAHYFFILGQAFRFLGNKESNLFLSIASYEKASALDPKNIKLQNSLLGTYMGLHEDYQSSNKPEPFWLEEAVYKKILTLSPNNPYALNNLGYLYTDYGVNLQVALQLCQKASDLAPENPGFRDSLGWVAFKNGKYDKAEEELKKSLSIKNNVYEPLYHLATVYYVTKKLDKAAELYTQAIQVKPDSAEALNNLAYLLAEQDKNIEDALKMSETAVKIEPNNASYLDTLGWLYFKTGKTEEALKYLNKAAQIAPNESEILLHIGLVHLEKSEFKAAIDYLKQALKTNPTMEEIEKNLYLALCLKSQLGTLAEYHNLFGEKVSKDKICNLLMNIARLYQEEKLYDKAIEFTQLCSDIKKDRKSLNEPLFGFYHLENAKKEKSPSTATEQRATNKQISELDKKILDETGSEEVAIEISSFPLVISIGPEFFKSISEYVSGVKSIQHLSFSLFLREIFKPANSAVLKIESDSEDGKSHLAMIEEFFQELGGETVCDENEIRCSTFFPGMKVYSTTVNQSAFLSRSPLPDSETLEKMSNTSSYEEDRFAEIVFNWKEIKAVLPRLIAPFISNPFKPFIYVHSNYSMEKGNLTETSFLSTGEEVTKEFMQNFARELFAYKLYTKKLGMDVTIQVKAMSDTILVITEYVQPFSMLSSLAGRYSPLFRYLSARYFSKYICYINRFLFSGNESDMEKLCPGHGIIRLDASSGTLKCNLHKRVPIFPLFMDPEGLCKFSRLRIRKILHGLLKKNRENLSDEELLKQIIEKYKIPICPATGQYSKDKDGQIKCTEHEN